MYRNLFHQWIGKIAFHSSSSLSPENLHFVTFLLENE